MLNSTIFQVYSAPDQTNQCHVILINTYLKLSNNGILDLNLTINQSKNHNIRYMTIKLLVFLVTYYICMISTCTRAVHKLLRQGKLKRPWKRHINLIFFYM